MILAATENPHNPIEDLNPDIIKAYIEEIMPNIINFGLKIIGVLLLYFIGTRIIRILRKMLRRFLERAQVDEGVKQFLDALLKAGLYVLLVGLVATSFGVTTASIVALMGSVGLAVGLAIQGSLSNFAGGVLILLLKPFKVGDYIIEDTKNNEGFVTEIQLFYTKLTTGDNKIIIIPNGSLANSSLTNVSGQEIRRLDIFVDVSYDSDIPYVKEILMSILEAEDRRIKEENAIVFVDSLKESSILIGCRIFVPSSNFFGVKCDLMEKILITLKEQKIEIPYAKLDVQLYNNNFSNNEEGIKS